MKRILLLVSCALLCPTHVITASEKNATRKTSRTTGTKKTARKADNKTTAKKTKQPRTQTTTAGSKAKKQTKTGKKTTKAATGSKVKTARTKTTTAGAKSTKAKAVKKAPQTTKATTASRAKKATYTDTGKKPAAKVAKKPRPAKDQTKRVYRKGGVTYRHFNHLQNMVPQQLGVISTPITQNVALNKPGRGYVNANLINFTTPDGKEGQVVLDTHTITAHRAEKKGFGASTHGKQSVEVFAGSDAVGKGLALIGEYPLAGNNVQIAVDPSGHVTLNGTEKPVEFSIHQ